MILVSMSSNLLWDGVPGSDGVTNSGTGVYPVELFLLSSFSDISMIESSCKGCIASLNSEKSNPSVLDISSHFRAQMDKE